MSAGTPRAGAVLCLSALVSWAGVSAYGTIPLPDLTPRDAVTILDFLYEEAMKNTANNGRALKSSVFGEIVSIDPINNETDLNTQFWCKPRVFRMCCVSFYFLAGCPSMDASECTTTPYITAESLAQAMCQICTDEDWDVHTATSNSTFCAESEQICLRTSDVPARMIEHADQSSPMDGELSYPEWAAIIQGPTWKAYTEKKYDSDSQNWYTNCSTDVIIPYPKPPPSPSPPPASPPTQECGDICLGGGKCDFCISAKGNPETKCCSKDYFKMPKDAAELAAFNGCSPTSPDSAECVTEKVDNEGKDCWSSCEFDDDIFWRNQGFESNTGQSYSMPEGTSMEKNMRGGLCYTGFCGYKGDFTTPRSCCRQKEKAIPGSDCTGDNGGRWEHVCIS